MEFELLNGIVCWFMDTEAGMRCLLFNEIQTIELDETCSYYRFGVRRLEFSQALYDYRQRQYPRYVLYCDMSIYNWSGFVTYLGIAKGNIVIVSNTYNMSTKQIYIYSDKLQFEIPMKEYALYRCDYILNDENYQKFMCEEPLNLTVQILNVHLSLDYMDDINEVYRIIDYVYTITERDSGLQVTKLEPSLVDIRLDLGYISGVSVITKLADMFCYDKYKAETLEYIKRCCGFLVDYRCTQEKIEDYYELLDEKFKFLTKYHMMTAIYRPELDY